VLLQSLSLLLLLAVLVAAVVVWAMPVTPLSLDLIPSKLAYPAAQVAVQVLGCSDGWAALPVSIRC
jgi:hypothetical protein